MIKLTVAASSLLVKVMIFFECELPRRPGHGTKGRQIKLKSNFYEVRNFADEIIHYNVTISDGRTEDDFPRDLSLLIIEELVKRNQNIFKKRPIYDTNKSLYSMDELPFKSKVSVSNTLKLFQLFESKDRKKGKLVYFKINSSRHFLYEYIQSCN